MVSKCRLSSMLINGSCVAGQDFGQAEKQFEKILAISPYRVDDIDVYSNILYVTENRLKLSRLAHEFLELDKDRPEVCCLVGESPVPDEVVLEGTTEMLRSTRKSLLPSCRA
jgi:hypothetical protein